MSGNFNQEFIKQKITDLFNEEIEKQALASEEFLLSFKLNEMLSGSLVSINQTFYSKINSFTISSIASILGSYPMTYDSRDTRSQLSEKELEIQKELTKRKQHLNEISLVEENLRSLKTYSQVLDDSFLSSELELIEKLK